MYVYKLSKLVHAWLYIIEIKCKTGVKLVETSYKKEDQLMNSYRLLSVIGSFCHSSV